MLPAGHKNQQRLPWRYIALPALLLVLAGAALLIFLSVRGNLEVRTAEQLLEQYDHTGRRVFLTGAREHLTHCLHYSPQSARLHFIAARAARRDNDSTAAERYLRRAEQLGWVKEAIELEQALAEVQRGKLSRYENVLLAFVAEKHPEQVLILEALAHGYEKTYHLHQAGDCLDLWLEQEPNQADALLQRAEVRLLTLRVDEAKADYLRGVELDPDADAARQRLGELLLSGEHAAEALVHFEELRRRHPHDPDALLGVARCKANLTDPSGAITVLDELLADHPHHAAALAERGKLALENGNSAAAERFLRESVTLAPFEHQAVYSFYRCLQKNGKTDEAAQWSKRLEAINADRAKLDEIKTALLKSPYDASLRSEMGRILLRNGQDRDGVRWLKSALAIDPKFRAAQEALIEHDRQVRSGQRPGAPH
jgi:tetratricopeptide (TPR) repeat protein